MYEIQIQQSIEYIRYNYLVIYNDERVNKYKLLICASTNTIYTFDTYII